MGPCPHRATKVSDFPVLCLLVTPTPPIRGSAGGGRSTFVGRSDELAALADAYDAAADGDLVCVLVAGEAGMGKTTLVRAFTDSCRERGIPVHWGSAVEAGGAPVFWPWTRAFRTTDADIRELARDRLTARAQDPFAAFDTLLEMLEVLRDRTPPGQARVMVLEDLHAADQPSLELLRFLTTVAAEDLRLLVIGTTRRAGATAGPGRDELLAEIAERSLRVTPAAFGLDEVRALLAASGAPDDGLAEAVLERTGGNPLYVDQLVDALKRGGPAVLAEVPDGIRAAVAARLAPLPEATRRALELASVLTPSFPAEVLGPMAGHAAAVARRELEPAVAAGILVEGPEGYSFAHAIVRGVVADELDPAERARLHARAADALAAAASALAVPPVVIAQHLVDAGDQAQPADAAHWAHLAAQAAQQMGGHRDAARWYGEAARRWAQVRSVHRQGEALAGAVAAHAMVGDGGRALRFTDQLAELARRSGSGHLLAQAALARADVFVPEQDLDAPPLLREALDHPDLADDAPLRADLLVALASLLGMPSVHGVRGDEGAARAAVAELAELAAAGDPHCRARYAEARLHVDSGPAHFAARPRWLQQLNDDLPPGPSLTERLNRAYWATSLAFEAGDLAEVDRRIRAWSVLADRSDASYWRWRILMARASLAYARGQFDLAEELANAGMPLIVNLHPEMAMRLVGGIVYTIRRDQGRLDEYLGLDPEAFGPLAGMIVAELANGDPAQLEQARRHLAEVEAARATTGPDDLWWLCLSAVTANLADLLGDAARCRAVAEDLVPYLGQIVMWGRSYVFGSPVAEVLGVAWRGAGEPERAAECFRHAMAWAEGAGAPGFWVRAAAGLVSVLPATDPARGAIEAQVGAWSLRLGMAGHRTDDAPRVTVRTLGRFEVVPPGATEPARWTSRKARDTLKLLISRRGRSIPREELIDLLWPDLDVATGRARLSVTLSILRSALDPERRLPSDPLRSDRQSVALDLDLVRVDLEELLEAAQRARAAVAAGAADAEPLLERAVSLAEAGDFLEEDPYTDWASPTRAQVASLREELRRSRARLDGD